MIDPSNAGDDEVNIFLRKQLVLDITTHKFGFGYTTVYGTAHNVVKTSTVPILEPEMMAQLDIDKHAQDTDTMITAADKKKYTRGLTHLPSSYT